MQIAWIAAVVAVWLLSAYAAITFVQWDAPRQGKDPMQWTGIVALTGVVGLFVYLLLRGRPAEAGEDAEPEFTLPGED